MFCTLCFFDSGPLQKNKSIDHCGGRWKICHCLQVQETMYLQMQGPQKPLPRILPAIPGASGVGRVWQIRQVRAIVSGERSPFVGSCAGGVTEVSGVQPQSRSRPRNSTAGLLSMLAMGAATMVTQEFRPSNRVLSRMRRARMARRFRNYQWEEAGKDGREVRLYIPVDQTINEKHVEIELSERRLRVALKTESVIDSDLYDSVHPHESHWFIDRHNSHACVAVTLMKKNMWTQWPFLTTHEAASSSSVKSSCTGAVGNLKQLVFHLVWSRGLRLFALGKELLLCFLAVTAPDAKSLNQTLSLLGFRFWTARRMALFPFALCEVVLLQHLLDTWR